MVRIQKGRIHGIVGSALVLVVMLGVVGASVWWMRAPREPIEQAEIDTPRKAPSTRELISYESNVLSVEEVNKTAHIVVTWATWCKPCMTVLHDLERIYEEYGGAVPILAINRGEPDPIARAYVVREFSNSPLLFVADQNDQYFTEVDGYADARTPHRFTRG